MKKLALILVCCLAVTLILGGCQQGSNSQSQGTTAATVAAASDTTAAQTTAAQTTPAKVDKIKVGIMSTIGAASEVVTANKMGYFKEQNLEVETVNFASGPPEVAAMVSGDLDFGVIGSGAHFLASQGKITLMYTTNLANSEKIIARKSSNIKTLADLKGKTIATPIGTAGEMILNVALKSVNLTQKDCNVVNMDVSGAVSAFNSNKVDVVSLWSPFTSQISKVVGDDNLTILATDKDFMPQYVFPTTWVVTPGYLKTHEDIAVRFVRALLKANDYRSKNLDQVTEWTAAFTGVPLDTMKAGEGDADWLNATRIEQAYSDGTAKQWYENLQQQFVLTKTLPQAVPVDNFFTADIVKKAAAN